MLADPEQALACDIDLIDQSQKVGAVLPMDFINANRANAGEIHVITPPRDCHRDGSEHLIPTRVEHPGNLFPTEALGPARQEPHGGGGQLVLAVGPGDLLDGHPTARTVDTPHHVEEEDAQAPERHELEAARYQPVVHRARLSAPRAPWPIAAMRGEVDRQREAGDLPRAAPCRRQIPDASESDSR